MGAQKAVLDMNKLSQNLGSKESQVGKRAIIQQKEEQFKDGLTESNKFSEIPEKVNRRKAQTGRGITGGN